MTNSNQNVGFHGEKIANSYLVKNGYQILQRNYHTRWGEIDVIAKKDSKISFFEVKTRIGDQKGKPYESVTPSKIRRLMRPIQYFLLQNDFKDYKLSLDVISIMLSEDLTVKEIKHFESVYR